MLPDPYRRYEDSDLDAERNIAWCSARRDCRNGRWHQSGFGYFFLTASQAAMYAFIGLSSP